KKPVAKPLLKLRQRKVRRVRLRKGALRTALLIELPHQRRIALPGLRRAHVFNSMPGPKAVGRAEGRQAALRAYARAGEHEDTIGRRDGDTLRHAMNRTRFRRLVAKSENPSEAKAQVSFGAFAARLKPCPFKTRVVKKLAL